MLKNNSDNLPRTRPEFRVLVQKQKKGPLGKLILFYFTDVRLLFCYWHLLPGKKDVVECIVCTS